MTDVAPDTLWDGIKKETEPRQCSLRRYMQKDRSGALAQLWRDSSGRWQQPGSQEEEQSGLLGEGECSRAAIETILRLSESHVKRFLRLYVVESMALKDLTMFNMTAVDSNR